ncbi:MAG: hypothetical protein HYW52_11275 [Gemmatimonadetes bacterium]|nr:hypothetical protein [Gemmatimonadota bacterium]
MNNPFEFVMALVAMGMVTGLLASVEQDLRQRLLDLEERLDFAERLLARERGPALPKGQ